uniref:Uncharacterized protein n=1 Tax=Romanomermis culicivorax TaxID=13658 RepID=A0A915HTT7_ROMCU
MAHLKIGAMAEGPNRKTQLTLAHMAANQRKQYSPFKGQSIEHLCDFDGNWWEYSYQKNSCLQADNDITCFECESLTYLLDMEYGLEDQKPVQPLPDVEYTFETLSPSQRQPPRIVTKGSLEIGNRIGEGKIEEPLTRLESTSLTSTKTVPKTSTAKRGQDESFNSEQRTTKQSVSGNDAAGDLTKQSVLGKDVGGAPGAPGDVSAIKTGSPATAIAETSTSGRVGETTMSTGVPTQRETINVVVAKKILKQKTTATPGTTIATSQVITTTQLLPSITQGIVTAEKAVTQTEVTMRTSSANQIIISFPETIPIATTSSQETVSTQEKTLKTSGMTENTSTQETIPEITVTGQEIIGIGQLPTKKSIKKVISQKSTAEKTTESQTTEPFTAGQGIGAMKIATGVTKIAASKKVAGVKKTTVGMIIAKKTLASTDTLNPVSEGADAGLGITSNPEEIIQKSTTSKKVVTKKTVAGKAVKSQTTGAIKIATGVTKMGASKKVAGAKKTTVGMIIAKKTLASTDTTNLAAPGHPLQFSIEMYKNRNFISFYDVHKSLNGPVSGTNQFKSNRRQKDTCCAFETAAALLKFSAALLKPAALLTPNLQ